MDCIRTIIIKETQQKKLTGKLFVEKQGVAPKSSGLGTKKIVKKNLTVHRIASKQVTLFDRLSVFVSRQKKIFIFWKLELCKMQERGSILIRKACRLAVSWWNLVAPEQNIRKVANSDIWNSCVSQPWRLQALEMEGSAVPGL
ncbi:uncharacterized protein LOC129285598 [Prosopis cineraria]|uniref:uncharacterized protein LOC129285598 n=1 Tax=Prosopis cineraria TaxID=364024 RepID=UPI002410A51A|nr:uncharacterized protein LOC129285598 [Prosopis cineraria]